MRTTRRNLLKAAVAGLVGSQINLKYFDYANATDKTNKIKSKFVRSTCSPNCTGACGFLAEVYKDKIVTLIQASDYPDDLYNPRGCLKGLSMTNLIYSKDRIKFPLIRTGKRGSGEFRKASWDEALDFLAENINKITKKYGSNSIALTIQVPGTGYVHKGAFVRLAKLFNWSIHHGYPQNGDLPIFWPMTFGVQSEELESLEWLNAAYTVIFGSNITKTRIPDAKQLIEAKKWGKVVVVDPDFCETAAKADEWIPIKADTDAAFALGLSKVIIDNNLFDREFLQDFTDFPILIRMDTFKRLKAKDLPHLNNFTNSLSIPAYREIYVYKDDNKFMPLNPNKLEKTKATLDVNEEVEIYGKKVRIRSVFNLLKGHLAKYTAESVSKITNIPADTIKRIAIEITKRKPLHIIYGAGNYQWYNGDLKGRAISLLPVLTGNIGISGGGISTYAGQYKIRFDLSSWWFPEEGKLNWVPYLEFLQGKGKYYPKNGIKAMIGGWGNPFEQHNMGNTLRERALNHDIEFIATYDFTMTTSCLFSDVVLPATSWYEQYELVATVLHPYLQLQKPAITPLFDSKNGLWIARELAKRLNRNYEKYFFPNLDENEATLKTIELLLKNGGYEVEGITLDKLMKGPVRLNSKAPNNRQIPFYEQRTKRIPFPPISYPAKLSDTAQFVKSGRIEFYKEEDLFIKENEQLPTHKESFVDTEYKANNSSKQKYPFRFITKNSLYRMHSTHSNNVMLNELQAFKPKIFISSHDAKLLGINRGELVEVYNDRGILRVYAEIDPGCSVNTLIFEQGWWSKFLQGKSYNSLIYPWIKPIHEIYFVPGIWEATTAWNECLVNVRKVKK